MSNGPRISLLGKIFFSLVAAAVLSSGLCFAGGLTGNGWRETASMAGLVGILVSFPAMVIVAIIIVIRRLIVGGDKP